MTTVLQGGNINTETAGTDIIKPVQINKVETLAALRWLKQGINDFKVSPFLSLSYGLVFALIGLGLIALTFTNPVYILGMVTVFYLIGPLIAVGLYRMSRQIEEGDKPAFGDKAGIRAVAYNYEGYAGFVIVVGMLVVLWTIVASALIAIFFSSATIAGTIGETIAINQQLYPFVAALMLVGLAFAVVSFMISVISIPMLTHRKVDAVTAITTSIRAVTKNPLPLLIWAALIALLVGVGFMFAFVGIAVALPVIGHASWHVYRDLVVEQ